MELKNVRLKKLEHLREEGFNAYPAKPSFALSEISETLGAFKKLASKKKALGFAGRVMAKREHGGSAFCDISDGKGNLPAGKAGLQVFLAKDKIGEKSFSLFSEIIDIGDFIAVWGKPFYTKRKEPTIEVLKWEMLAKSLLPLPEKWHGLQGVEERFRKRYLDLLMNEDVSRRFKFRTELTQAVREFYIKNGFLEVETPIFHPIPGGALA